MMPDEKSSLKREGCRDYAFVLKKVERAHIGEAPRHYAYAEEKILSKIEKRILKLLKKADRTMTPRICKDTFWDALRYTVSMKYGYKKRFLGKDRLTWNLLFGIGAAVLALVFILACWILG